MTLHVRNLHNKFCAIGASKTFVIDLPRFCVQINIVFGHGLLEYPDGKLPFHVKYS